MYQEIQTNIYELLDNLIINENNKKSRDIIIYNIYEMLNSHNYRNVSQFKVTCDESNNFKIGSDMIFISVYIYIGSSSCSTIMDFVIKIDKLKMK